MMIEIQTFCTQGQRRVGSETKLVRGWRCCLLLWHCSWKKESRTPWPCRGGCSYIQMQKHICFICRSWKYKIGEWSPCGREHDWSAEALHPPEHVLVWPWTWCWLWSNWRCRQQVPCLMSLAVKRIILLTTTLQAAHCGGVCKGHTSGHPQGRGHQDWRANAQVWESYKENDPMFNVDAAWVKRKLEVCNLQGILNLSLRWTFQDALKLF